MPFCGLRDEALARARFDMQSMGWCGVPFIFIEDAEDARVDVLAEYTAGRVSCGKQEDALAICGGDVAASQLCTPATIGIFFSNRESIFDDLIFESF